MKSRRILIVDDNADSGEAMSTMLRHWGHEVKFAENGQGALKVLDTFTADVAFIDIGLPDIDGYQLAERIRAGLGAKIRLIAITGYGTSADRKRAKAAGFDEHVTKPAEPAHLESLLSPGSSA